MMRYTALVATRFAGQRAVIPGLQAAVRGMSKTGQGLLPLEDSHPCS
jgi:hypothetical protein